MTDKKILDDLTKLTLKRMDEVMQRTTQLIDDPETIMQIFYRVCASHFSSAIDATIAAYKISTGKDVARTKVAMALMQLMFDRSLNEEELKTLTNEAQSYYLKRASQKGESNGNKRS